VKAAFFKEHDGVEKIVYGDYRHPVPEAGDVVVRVKACALNQIEDVPDGALRVCGKPVQAEIRSKAFDAAPLGLSHLASNHFISVHCPE